MAVSPVTVAEMALYNTAYAVTKDAVNADGHTISIDGLKDGKVAIFFDVTASDGTVDFTISAGAYSDSAQGSLAVSYASTITGLKVITLESARFKDASGVINIAYAISAAATVTGDVFAVELP